MDDYFYRNVTIAERYLRAIIGFSILFFYLLSPVNPLVFALFVLLSLYLLTTALVAWDPVYALIYKVISWIPDSWLSRGTKTDQPDSGLFA